jgi:predicted alpha/beta hydrolase family esterase
MAKRKTAPKSVLFVQGGGRDVHDGWDNKLVASLGTKLGPGYTIRYPRMPDEANPDPAAWKKAIDRERQRLGGDVILIGHSVGAAVLLDYLADTNRQRRPAGIFLIAAPFIGDGGWPSHHLRPTKEAAASLPDGAPIYLYQGADDQTVPFSHVDMLATAFPGATVRRLKGRDHQLNEDLSEVASDVRTLGRKPSTPRKVRRRSVRRRAHGVLERAGGGHRRGETR